MAQQILRLFLETVSEPGCRYTVSCGPCTSMSATNQEVALEGFLFTEMSGFKMSFFGKKTKGSPVHILGRLQAVFSMLGNVDQEQYEPRRLDDIEQFVGAYLYFVQQLQTEGRSRKKSKKRQERISKVLERLATLNSFESLCSISGKKYSEKLCKADRMVTRMLLKDLNSCNRQ
mmetsp:Transcript_49968/g.128597  ORF Transcript_49968/g.128597 Transcript_49968/m.128597 type:complete len:174 (-) Transcript_49968:235-756(-)